MSMGEIVVILVVAILVLGPEKLPSTAVQIAKILKALKRQVDEAKESINQELRISELKEEAQKYKDEFSEYNQNIRKKLSFEEFDELKESLAKEKAQISQSLDEIQKDIESLSPENLASEGAQGLNLNGEKGAQNAPAEGIKSDRESALNEAKENAQELNLNNEKSAQSVSSTQNDIKENALNLSQDNTQNPAAQGLKSKQSITTNTAQIELNELSAQISQNTIQNSQNKTNSQNEIQKNTVQNLENKQNGIQENINLAQDKSLNLSPKNTPSTAQTPPNPKEKDNV